MPPKKNQMLVSSDSDSDDFTPSITDNIPSSSKQSAPPPAVSAPPPKKMTSQGIKRSGCNAENSTDIRKKMKSSIAICNVINKQLESNETRGDWSNIPLDKLVKIVSAGEMFGNFGRSVWLNLCIKSQILKFYLPASTSKEISLDIIDKINSNFVSLSISKIYECSFKHGVSRKFRFHAI